MASPAGPSGDPTIPLHGGSGSELVTNPMTAPYPSPTPNAAETFTGSSFGLQQAQGQAQREPVHKAKRRCGDRDKSAKDYWRRQYATSLAQHNSDQPELKRKDTGGGEDWYRSKRQRASEGLAALQNEQSVLLTAAVDKDGPIAARAKLGDVSMQNDTSCKTTIEQLGIMRKDIDPANQKALQELSLLQEATLSFGVSRCKPVSGKWRLSGFGTPLYHHQLIGVRWMLGREMAPHGPNGGILADEMGLGKTVQLLACMSQNLPAKNARVDKTLVVAPKKLLYQWFNEIKNHCINKEMKRVFIYASNTVMMDRQWEDESIILTNYEQIQRQLPPKDKLEEIEKLRAARDPAWKTALQKHGGPLFQTTWHRIVLDEAHAINNRSSQTSRACRNLISNLRWVLTGTPMTNSMDEFFSYLDFLMTRYNHFNEYRDAMGDIESQEQHKEKLAMIYQEISLRRRVGDKFMGKPIIQIPKTHPPEVINVAFSPLEHGIYREIRDRYTQICDDANTSAALGGTSVVPKEEIAKLFHFLRYFSSHPALLRPECLASNENPEIKGPEPLEVTTTVIHFYCRLCRNVLEEPRIGVCGHAFCKRCISAYRKVKREARCLSCNAQVTLERTKPAGDDCFYPISHHEGLAGVLDGSCQKGKQRTATQRRKPGDDECGLQPRLAAGAANKDGRRKNSAKRKSKSTGRRERGKIKKARTDDGMGPMRANARAFLRRCDEEPWNPIPHGVKTRAALELVQKWQKEAPEDNIIIFVQWIPMLCILGRMLFQNGFPFVYFWGEMGNGEQQRSIQVFQKVSEVKVMLISLSCGAHGLNLTAANRAIVFDHWWHKCLEHQAFARIHRIGQTKEVHTAKLVVKESLDEKILKMQAAKEETIASTMEAGALTRKPTRLEIRDLLCKDGQLDEELLAGVDMDDSDNNDNGSSMAGISSDDDDNSDGNSNNDSDYMCTDDDSDGD
ncbi:DNA repair protein RAD16 [Madurella fahalii]|uniref:DNA repair protein RAD16 n=1 Tax=Madurella fahalii TaxID=1157608 RepID=A0ABQ0GT28_9PEZI